MAGAGLVLRRKFSASRWVDQVREGGVTVTNFLGVMMDFVWKQAERENDADNPLRCIFAAPTASSILAGFRKRFGVEAFVEVFGLTETSMPILSPYGEDRPAGAAGLLVADWFDIQLVDPETDKEVPVGQVGELVVRSKYPWTLSMGYYGMPAKTVEAWRNLWFHTGDALRRVEDGWYYFVDRYKDALRRRGRTSARMRSSRPCSPIRASWSAPSSPCRPRSRRARTRSWRAWSPIRGPIPARSGNSAPVASRPSRYRALSGS